MRLILPLLLVPTALVAAPDLTLPGARVTEHSDLAETRIAMPDAVWRADLLTRQAEGATTLTAWEVLNSDATPLQLVRPLRDALTNAGFDVVFECADIECGGYDFRFSLNLLPAPSMFVDLGAFHYVLARDGTDEVALLASKAGNSGFVHVTVVGTLALSLTVPVAPEDPLARPVVTVPEDDEQPAGLPAPEVRLSPSDIAGSLEAFGRVPLDDVAFASGSTELAKGTTRDLTALASWLRANPASRIALVGHTDAVGGLDGNTRISRARAEAVARKLIGDFEIEPGRIEAEGAGYLAPRAPNTTPEGRARNRRVEAVLLDTE